jgi:hypothetical protein
MNPLGGRPVFCAINHQSSTIAIMPHIFVPVNTDYEVAIGQKIMVMRYNFSRKLNKSFNTYDDNTSKKLNNPP